MTDDGRLVQVTDGVHILPQQDELVRVRGQSAVAEVQDRPAHVCTQSGNLHCIAAPKQQHCARL